jgi:hypothetical protein
MKKISTRLAACALLGMATCASQAQVASSIALLGWTAFGDASTAGQSITLTTAHAPDEVGNLSGTNPLNFSALTVAAQVGGAALDLAGEEITEGSLIRQSFSLLAGQTLSFSWGFATADTSPPTAAIDHAFAVIDTRIFTLATRAAPGLVTQTFSYTPVGSGSFSLALGVADTLDVTGVSTLTISNLQVSAVAVPEPAALALWLAGLGVVGACARSRRRAAAQGVM